MMAYDPLGHQDHMCLNNHEDVANLINTNVVKISILTNVNEAVL